MVAAEPACTRKLVEGAVQYARTLGFATKIWNVVWGGAKLVFTRYSRPIAPFPLTPALSLGERGPRTPSPEHSSDAGFADTLPKILPAPEPRKHPTSNIERPTSNNGADTGLWMFDVRCWMLGVLALQFRGPRREKSLSGNSLPKGEGWGEGERGHRTVAADPNTSGALKAEPQILVALRVRGAASRTVRGAVHLRGL
jgi:hypothetical protein